MLLFSNRLQSVRILALVLVLLISVISESGAGTSVDGICNLNADQALGLENYPVAIELHQQFLRTHNNDALAHYHLGFAYGMTGRKADEITEYLAAARLGLEQWDLFLNLGLAYLDQHDWSKAISTFKIAVLLGPAHPEAHFNLAIAYERDNKLAKALQEITASLLLSPADPDEHNTKAIICAERGDLVCARNEWTYLLQVSPEYAPARANLAILRGSHLALEGTAASSGLNGKSLAFAHRP
jgi:Flp pilus assembly protein TadD